MPSFISDLVLVLRRKGKMVALVSGVTLATFLWLPIIAWLFGAPFGIVVWAWWPSMMIALVVALTVEAITNSAKKIREEEAPPQTRGLGR